MGVGKQHPPPAVTWQAEAETDLLSVPTALPAWR